jgi:protein TonB
MCIRDREDEVIRVVSSSPTWEPGRQRGTAVNVAFTFPVTFALQ